MNKAHPGGFTSCEPSSKVLLGERGPQLFGPDPAARAALIYPSVQTAGQIRPLKYFSTSPREKEENLKA